MLSLTVILMAGGTFMIGVIPTYAAIGAAAPLLLVLARVVQGFSTGGEYAGAMTFVAEYSPDRRRGFFGSRLEFGTLSGYAFGASLTTVLSLLLPEQFMADYGWRIPFLMALPLGLVGLYLRTRLEDTPAYRGMLTESDRRQRPRQRQGTGAALRTILTRHWPALLLAGGLVTAWNVTNYMLTSYMLTSYMLLVLLMVVVTFLGRLSDRIGRRPILLAGSIALIVLGLPMTLLLRTGSLPLVLAGLVLMGLTLVCFSAVCPATLPALFPTEIRYGSLAVAFNIFVSAFGGTTALVMSSLVYATGDLNWPGYYLIAAGLVGLVTVVLLSESARRPLPGSSPAASSPAEARELSRDRP